MQWLIVELNPNGHRLVYLGHLIRRATCPSVVLIGPPDIQHTEPWNDNLPGVTLRQIQARHRLSALAKAVWAGMPGDRVVVPDGDRYLLALLGIAPIAAIRRVNVRVLMMRTSSNTQTFGRALGTVLKRSLVLALTWCRPYTLFFLTDAFNTVHVRAGYPRLRPLPDPVRVDLLAELRPEAKQLLTTFTTGIVGVIDPRKNVPAIVAALNKLPSHFTVEIAGKVSTEVSDYICSSADFRTLAEAGRAVVHPGYLDTDAFDAAIRRVDVVAVLHDNDSPSGIMGEAAARGIPCLVPAGGWLDVVASSSGIGIAVQKDPEMIARALTTLRDDYRRFSESCERAASESLGVERFVSGLLGFE